MSRRAQIIVVDDEPAMREMIGGALRRGGFDYREAADAIEARKAVYSHRPDLIILDWMLPGRSGVDLAAELRKEKETRDIPIILLSARSEDWDKVHGLDVGADDYITKPFSVSELLARIRALLRRSSSEAATNAVEIDGLRVDPDAHRVTAGDQPVDLSATEFRLLHFLMTHPNRVHNRARIIDRVWGTNIYVGERTVDVHVRMLRKALEPSGHDDLIQTVRGAGYRLTARDAH